MLLILSCPNYYLEEAPELASNDRHHTGIVGLFFEPQVGRAGSLPSASDFICMVLGRKVFGH